MAVVTMRPVTITAVTTHPVTTPQQILRRGWVGVAATALPSLFSLPELKIARDW
jgi:hypothetical protein